MKKAAALLRDHFPNITFSSVYESAPMYDKNQAPFLNAVAKIETEKSPESLFGISRNTEIALKKNTPHTFGPRTIDLDLLLYDDLVIHVAEKELVLSSSKHGFPLLTIPHPRMHERRFVLEPLCELIEEDAMHPTLQKSWSSWLTSVQDQECEKAAIPL